MALMMFGCSQKVTTYVSPKKTTFVIADVNVSTIPLLKPTDINLSKDKTQVTTSVNTFSNISDITKKLRIQVKIYKEAFESLKRQIERYRKTIKESKVDEKL